MADLEFSSDRESFGHGRYRLLDRIGQGTVGTVYRAEVTGLPGEIVALKILYPEHCRNRKTIRRFRTEVEVAFRVSHPNIIRPYEFVQDGNVLGLSMEYASGGDLREYLNEQNSVSPADVVKTLLDLTSALQVIHEAGVIHRDIKPENILLSQDGLLKLSDFSTALLVGGPRITEPGKVLGSIPYVCPEYISQGRLDERSDLYALGVLGYEMLTGDHPFDGESPEAILNNKLLTDVIPPDRIAPECSKELSEIIVRALERNPENRFPSAEVMNAYLATL